MNPYLQEVLERTRTGPYCSEKDFDLKIVFPRLQELVREYNIKFNEDKLIPEDNDLANSVYEAGLKLFAHTGAYCKDSSRRIIFEENEIRRRIENCKKELILGDGKEARKISSREVDGDSELLTMCGTAGGQISEEFYLPNMMSYIREPLTDAIITGALRTVDGLNVKAGTPTEILAARREVELIREAQRRCGRLGLQYVGINSAVTPIGTFAAYTVDGGLRRSEGAGTGYMTPHFKLTYDILNKVTMALETNKIIAGLNTAFVGGLSGGPEGTAVVLIAEQIAGFLMKQTDLSLLYPANILSADIVDAPSLWASSVAAQGLALNTDFLTVTNTFSRAGPCTDALLYHVAAVSILASSSGFSGVNGVGSTSNLLPDHCTGLEARFMCEVARSATGLNRNESNNLLKKVYEKYKSTLSNPPRGKAFKECYDLETLEPSEEWDRIYLKIRNEMNNLGLTL